MSTILIIEDEPVVIQAFSFYLVGCGFVVMQSPGLTPVLEAIDSISPDLILLDLRLNDSPNAEKTIEKIPILATVAPVVVITGGADPGLIEKATDAGASGFVLKIDFLKDNLLLKTIERILEHQELYTEVQKTEESLGRIEAKIKRAERKAELGNGGAK